MRTWWFAPRLNYVAPEPLLFSLLRYRRDRDRSPARPAVANLVSSLTDDGWQMPIVDLDFPHRYVPSSTPGHAHLYLDVPIPHWRWVILQIALHLAGVQETGNTLWSLRRGANYVRPPGIQKTPSESRQYPTHGVLRSVKSPKG